MDGSGLRLAGLAACLFLLPGCLGFSWTREERLSPVPEAGLAALQPGTSMEDCLAALGAPIYLWEYRGSGIALAWGALEARNLGFTVSFAITKEISGSVNYDHIDEDFEGVVLVFGEDMRLRWIRRGFLREIAQESRRPAAWIEDDSEAAGGDA